jgi:hypothetical protein
MSWARGSSDAPNWRPGREWSCYRLSVLRSHRLTPTPRAFQRYHVQRVLHDALLSLLARQWHFTSGLLHRRGRSGVAWDDSGGLHGRRIVGRARGKVRDASSAEWQQGSGGSGCPDISSSRKGGLRALATHLAGPLRPQTSLSTAYWRQRHGQASG